MVGNFNLPDQKQDKTKNAVNCFISVSHLQQSLPKNSIFCFGLKISGLAFFKECICWSGRAFRPELAWDRDSLSSKQVMLLSVYTAASMPPRRSYSYRKMNQHIWAPCPYVPGSGHETVHGLFIVPTGFHRGLCCQPSRRADWLARTSRVVCLCCVVFCLPPRLWVTIHTLPRVQLRGTVPASSLAWL